MSAARRQHWRELGGLALVTLVLRAPSFAQPFRDLDEGSYAAIACRMLQGGLPYRDGVENKFPGIYYVYYALFRAFGRYDMLALHITVALVALATAITVGAIARRLAGDRAGRLAALLYAVLSCAYYPKMQAGNCEMFLVLPSSLAILSAIEAERSRGWGRAAWWIAAGVCAAIAASLKQVATATVVALLADRAWPQLVALVRRRETGVLRALGQSLLMLAGFALVAAAWVAYLVRAGIWADAKFWTWTYVFSHYLPAGTRDHGLAFHAATSLLPFLVAVSPAFVPLLALTRARDRGRFALLWWWLVGMMSAAMVGGRLYGHYMLMFVPPVCALGGIGADRFLDEPRLRQARRALSIVLFATALGPWIAGWLVDGATGTFLRPQPDYRQAAAYLDRVTTPDERVFVWGWFPALYQAADRCPSTRFVYTHVLSGATDPGSLAHQVPEGWRMLMDDLERAPPRYILDTSPGDYIDYAKSPPEHYPPLADFLAARYTVETEIEGVRFFRLKQP